MPTTGFVSHWLELRDERKNVYRNAANALIERGVLVPAEDLARAEGVIRRYRAALSEGASVEEHAAAEAALRAYTSRSGEPGTEVKS